MSLSGDLEELSRAAEWLVPDDGRFKESGDGVPDPKRNLDFDILEDIESRAERATDRIEVASVSVSSEGAEVGPGPSRFAECGRPLALGDDCPDSLLASGRDVDDADRGDRSSGVPDRAATSALASLVIL